MFKKLTLGLLLISSMGLYAQTSVPNGDLEDWSNITFDSPSGFPFSSNMEKINDGDNNLNVSKSTDSHTGSFAIKLSTLDDGFGAPDPAYMVNGQPQDDNPFNWTGTQPISGTPTALTGFYKYNQASGDSAIVIITFSTAGVQTGVYMGKFGGLKASYTAFTIPLIPALPIAPDSVTIAFSGSDVFGVNATIGSELLLDDLSFVGIATQPTWLDGGFETWSTLSIDTPNDWYADGGQGIIKSTASATGSYAAMLITSSDINKSGVPVARPCRMTNGYYPDGCNGFCQQLGGIPYSIKKDSLVFRYKYFPSGLDTAQVFINLKKDGAQIMGNNIYLYASPTYKTAKIGWDMAIAPDSIIINIESSTWRDSAITFVGSTLFIDDIHFDSDRIPTGLFKVKQASLKIAPNPAVSSIEIAGIETACVKIITMQGGIVLSAAISPISKTIDLSGVADGTYIVLIDTGKEIFSEKLLVKK